jgi:FkbM family methyltransferase
VSVAPSTALRGHARQWLSAAGLLPLVRRTVHLCIRLRCAAGRDFSLTIDGTEVRFITTDAYSSHFFHRRYRRGELHEPPVTIELARRARNARVFADVGAHVAYYSCIAGTVNDRLRLFVFEMNQDMIPVIERNLRENGRGDAVVVNRAVADRRRIVRYAGSSREPGLRMRPPDRVPGAEHVLAETVSLDEFFGDAGTVPDLIKIDVEGAELEVLRGAREIIAQHHPAVFVEVHPKLLGDFGSSVDQVYSFLRKHGYVIQRYLGHRTDGIDLELVEPTAALPDQTHMLLCT